MNQFKMLYDYILENYGLDGVSGRLIRNILNYVETQGFVDNEDNISHLHSLLDFAFGLSKEEIKAAILSSVAA